MEDIKEPVAEIIETEVVNEINENEEITNVPEIESDPSAEIDETKKKEDARKHFEDRKSKRERLEQIERENEYLRKQLESHQAPRQQAQYNDPNEPDLEAYLDRGLSAQQWNRDHIAYINEENNKKSANIKIAQTYASQIEAYSKSTPEIYDYVKEAERMVNSSVQDAILRSKNAAELIEKIALDPKFASELNNSSNIYDLVGKIKDAESLLVKNKTVTSSAPRPPSIKKSDAAISGEQDISKLTHAQYRAFRDKQRKRN